MMPLKRLISISLNTSASQTDGPDEIHSTSLSDITDPTRTNIILRLPLKP
jgi:hypothetical protein